MIPREEWHLDTRLLGRRVLVFDRLDSTNTQAAALADDMANDGVVILAEEQTAGRGQHRRTWACPAGSGVLLSVLLFPPPALRRPVILAAWAALSVCETIRLATGLQAKIKWPNDVLLQGRKVCGILIEQACGTVVGIGLNVNQPADWFAAAGLPDAASLAVLSGTSLSCAEVARMLIGQLDEAYDQLCRGDSSTLESCWKWRTGLLGKPVIVECGDGLHYGRLRELTWEGLELESAVGQVRSIQPEIVKHITCLPLDALA